MIHLYRPLTMNGACRTRSSCGGVSEWMWRPWALLYTVMDFIHTVHLGYTEFTNQQRLNQEQEKIMRSRDAINEMYDADAAITQHNVLQHTYSLFF